METITNKIKVFNYYWDLLIPLLAAVIAIYYDSPTAKYIIIGGWLPYLIYLTTLGELRNKKLEEASTSIPFFFIRLIMLLIIPASSGELTFKDYFYSELLAEMIALILVIIFMFIFHKKENGEKLSDFMGVGMVIFLVIVLIISILPFIIVIKDHLIESGNYSFYYSISLTIPAIFYNYQLFSQLSKGKINGMPNDEDFATKLVFGGLFLWFALLIPLYIFT